MRTNIHWRDKVHFVATAGSGHSVPLDGPPDAGGENRGCRPMELVLMGLGGCSAFDVPHVFTRIHLHFTVSGRGLDEKKVARAVSLSAEKYCSASIMLQRGGVEITHGYEVAAE